MLVSLDIDDVCFGYVVEYARWRAANGLSSYNPLVQPDYNFAASCGISREQNHADMVEFVNDPNTLLVKPIEGCHEQVQVLHAAGFEMVALTHRSPLMRPGTEEWVRRWLPEIGDVLMVGPAPHKPSTPKVQVCQQLGVSAHVDDNPSHLRPLENTSTVPVLFGSNPWSIPGPWPHADNWAQVPPILLNLLRPLEEEAVP